MITMLYLILSETGDDVVTSGLGDMLAEVILVILIILLSKGC